MEWVALALEFQLGAVALVSPFLNCFLSLEPKETKQTPSRRLLQKSLISQ